MAISRERMVVEIRDWCQNVGEYNTYNTWWRGGRGLPSLIALFFHILGLNLKMSYQIASLFHMYIDMGETIAGKQDRFSLIIEDPPQGPQNTPKIYIFFTFWPINEKMVFKLFPLVVHMSPLWWGLRLLTFWCPLVPLDLM